MLFAVYRFLECDCSLVDLTTGEGGVNIWLCYLYRLVKSVNNWLMGSGEGEGEGAAFAFFAFDPNTAVMVLHNMAANCQP